MLRKRNSPGIEINEIDRSQYNKVQDYSLPNAPVCLITGFADKGENYKTQWINSSDTFIKQYGIPTNIPEQYFYNGAMEILKRGGILLTNKFPYYNSSKDKFPCIQYKLSKSINIIKDKQNISINEIYNTINDIKTTLINLLNVLKFEYDENNLNTIKQIQEKCVEIEKSYNIKADDISKINDIKTHIQDLIQKIKLNSTKYSLILENDQNLTSYIDIDSNNVNHKLIDINEYDNYLTNYNNQIINNTGGTITIVDISNNKYEKTSWNSLKTDGNNTNDCLGIIPVLISPVNALFYQKLLNTKNSKIIIDEFNLISNMSLRLNNNDNKKINFEDLNEKINTDYLSKPFSSEYAYDINNNREIEINEIDNVYDNSWSKYISQYFPNINYNNDSSFDNLNMKKIGIVVLKAFQDKQNNDILNFEILESFIGSLDKNAKNNITKSSEFIDNIVNSQSNFINVFTNIDKNELEKTCFIAISNQIIHSLGFYEFECEKKINYKESILKPMNRMFGVLNNNITQNIDLIVDAGMSNIAEYLSIDNNEHISLIDGFSRNNIFLNAVPIKWQQIIKMFDDFCKYTRRDCMFIADCPRTFCLEGEQKIIRNSNLNNTIEKTILPKLKYINNINSSYTAGYCDWFKIQDEYSGDFFWCPPSIKAAGIYCYTDIYFHPWDAPAGMIRGIVRNVIDTAFSPINDEAGKIYSHCWNYAINYPINGIIMEGQKTFQKNYTAFDRINVRRLMLYLEKRTSQIAKQFLYEGNTAYIRQKFVDTLIPLFEDTKNGNGIIDYIIRCDETNNTPTTIDNNELHVTIAVKPVKTVEYIVVNFIVTNQSANINEEVLKI